MKISITKRQIIFAAILLAAGALATAPAADFYLRAAEITNASPSGDGQILCWGFARDTAFGARDGVATVPGPGLVVPPGDTTLTIHLDNDLAEPVSIVIPGQAPAASQAPVRNAAGRVTAFTFETPAGNTAAVNYTWTNLRPGTYLYHSGSHPAVQRPMGLYGVMTHDYLAGQAYTNIVYNRELILCYGEIDPGLNKLIAQTNYGPGKLMTSTINYNPGFYLINANNYTNGVMPFPVTAGENVLVRFINAGSRPRLPVLYGQYLRRVAEDGYLYPYAQERYSLVLPPHKTMDALVTAASTGTLMWYDRRGVSNPPPPLDSNANGLPDVWEETWFGGYTNAKPDLDSDGDGFSNLREYTADTNPTNAQSFIRLAALAVAAPTGCLVVVTNTSPNRCYRLFSRAGLESGLGPWVPLTGFVPGTNASLTIIDTNAPAGTNRIYKVEVDLP